MDSEDDLDLLTALLAESEGIQEQDHREQPDALDDLFDAEEEEEEYKEGVEEEGPIVSTQVEDTEEEERDAEGKGSDEGARLGGSTVDLQDQLRRMQEQMQRLQQQLEASQKVSPSSSTLTAGSSASPKTMSPKTMSPKTMTPTPMTSKPITPKTMTPTPPPAARPPTSKRPPAKPSSTTQKTKAHAAASPSTAASGGGVKLQESADFFDQLNNADSFKRKPRVAHLSTPGSPPEDRGPLMEIKIGGTFQPAEGGSSSSISKTFKRSGRPAATGTPRASSLPPLPKDVGVEKYSGLRLRKPRVSSSEMDRKMADRRRIRLSEVPERLAQEKLEDSDWVTFAVLVNKVTPQSNSSGKTFSIWKLSDLHNLEVFVSLLLFGEVHKELWKTEPGTVIGLLNPNPMKQKEGYDGVSLTVDNPQKVLLLGEAQDYSTCKAPKKNGDPCSQIVNTFECEYCQYHVKAQYKLMSSKRAELQSAYSGKAPGKVKGKGKGGGLRERLCQDGFYYGGVSSPACAASLASNPNKPVQKTLDKLFVKGAAQLVHQAKRLALQAGEVAGCSNEFKSLLSAPTPGALQLKKHLAQGGPSGTASRDAAAPSFSASDLLKQQKRSQREFLQNRRRRADEIQKRAPPSAAGPSAAGSPSSPLTTPAPVVPRGPALGRGFAEGEDILFFENGPPPVAPAPLGLSAAKMAAMRKLRAKGATGLDKEDPNAVKRKRSSDGDISARVEKSLTSPKGDSSGNEEEEPFQKRRREKLLYIQSEGFQKILNAKSRHDAALQAAEYQLQERYFDPLVKKEQMEEKMKGTREMKCRAVSCKKCNYTYFKPADRCVEEAHSLRWHDATKRFFKCPCGQRAIALDRLPHQHCSNCGLFKWERDGMLKEKRGPKIGGELLQPRGEEHGQFLNSMK